ncbi:MAG: Hpt domain-containing protein [Steroidobacteraceae bacterium]
MEPISQVAPQTLDLIGRELNATLADARTPLEAFIEQPDNYSLLERSAAELHRVQGVLRVLEIYGAALLAEEMEQVARYIIESAQERKSPAESLDALLRAMVQLPSYLDRVLAGGRDLALVLLPLLNDLRAVRGSPLLSEGTLLLLNLKSDRRPEASGGPDLAAASPNVTVAARRLRTQFQLGLVGWIRGEREAEHLAALASVAQQMEQVATQQPVFQLWWVVGAVIEALAENGLESSVSVKRLLGLADRELKRLYEQGEPRYCQTPPVELLNNLLYYVARASSHGPRVSAVRASFRLDELLPVDQAVEEERDTLSAPSIKLMQTVAAAIREDLGKVKDTLDIFVRRGSGQAAELGPQVELLRKIGDTLGVLGLGELRDSIQRELQRLEDIVAERAPATEAVLIDIATTLINVEDRLDSSLLRLIVPRQDTPAATADDPAPSEDFLHVQAAVLRECAVNLARIKEAVAQNVGGTLDAAGLDAWPELLRGIKAGLLLLGRMRAVNLIDEIGECLQRVMQPGGGSLPPTYMDRLADAIVSVEYYMETLQAGRAEPDYMLDNAQACIDALRRAPAAEAPTVPPLAASAYAKTVLLDPSGASIGPDPERTDNLAPTMLAPALRLPAGAEPAAGETSRRLRALGDGTGSFPRAAPPVLAAAAPPVIAPTAAASQPPVSPDTDPELLEIFIEEAREEVARIQQYHPEWDRNPGDGASLAIIRRSFHTLKGSGRMVGARPLAEFAWAIENLLNRLIDGTVERSPAVAGTLRDAVALVPQLVEHLAGGAAPSSDSDALAARAHSLAAAQPADTETQLGLSAAPLAAPPSAPAVEPGPEAPVAEPFAGQPVDAQAVGAPPLATAAELEATHPGFVAPPPASEPEPEREPAVEPQAAADDAAASVDTTLRDIYLRETDAHVDAVRQFIASRRGKPAPHELDEAVYRACHTLSGSSKMAEARHGIRLAEPLDRWLRKSWGSGVGLLDADLDLLGDCMTAMQQVARHMDESTQFFLQHDLLRERVARAEIDLDRRIGEAAEAENVEMGSGTDGPDVGVAEAPAAEAADGGAGADGGAAAAVAEPAADDFDPEIAGIFLDEASELIDASQAALQDWNDAPDDAARIAALKRPLHTLKGGARMAGIASMGDLAHELETLIGQLELGTVAAVDDAREATQASLDELARMRDQVAQGRGPRAATRLIERLQALSRGEPTDSTQRQPVLPAMELAAVAGEAVSPGPATEDEGGETVLARALQLPPEPVPTPQPPEAEAIVAERRVAGRPMRRVIPVVRPPPARSRRWSCRRVASRCRRPTVRRWRASMPSCSTSC